VTGRGALYVIKSQGSRSVVARAFAASPLKFLTPRNHGHAAWVYTSTYGGGFVDGDTMQLDVEVGAGAAALLSTQASTKIYRSPRGTRTEFSATIRDGGLLVAAPDPIVCFAGSRHRQRQEFALEGRASLVALDWMSSGRREAGERWVFDEYSTRLAVRSNGRLVVHDALRLHAGDGDLAERIGRFDVIATLVLCGPAVSADAETLVARVDALPVARRPDSIAGATRLEGGGCLARLAGRSVEDVGRSIRSLLGFLPGLLGDDLWTRKM
jgi:urease accessory protein